MTVVEAARQSAGVGAHQTRGNDLVSLTSNVSDDSSETTHLAKLKTLGLDHLDVGACLRDSALAMERCALLVS